MNFSNAAIEIFHESLSGIPNATGIVGACIVLILTPLLFDKFKTWEISSGFKGWSTWGGLHVNSTCGNPASAITSKASSRLRSVNPTVA